MTATDRRVRLADAAALAFCAALAALYVTRHVLDGDEAIFAAIGMRMRALGLPPYAGGWDHKPPGIFWIYEALLSPWSESALLWLHAASAACWVATAWIVGLAARRLLGAGGFAPAVVAYGLLRSFGDTKAGAANTEAFLSPLLAAGLLVGLAPSARPARSALLAGAALGAAFLLKPPVAVYGPALVVAAGIVRGPRAAWTAAWGGLVGAAAVVGGAAAYLAARGTLAEGWMLNTVVNRIYMASSARHGAGEVLAGLVDEPTRAAAPWIFALVAGVCALARPARLGADARRWTGAFAVLFAAGVVAVSAGGVFFRHYWLMLHPVLAVAAAAGVVALVSGATARARWSGAAVAALVVATTWLPAQWTDKRRLAASFLFHPEQPLPYEGRAFADAAAGIRRYAGPDDTVFVWGSNPELHLMSERAPASRHVSSAFLSGWIRLDVREGRAPPDPDAVPGAWDAFFADVEARPPKVVVDTAPAGYRGWDRFPVSAFPRLAFWLQRDYERAEAAGGATIYVRREH